MMEELGFLHITLWSNCIFEALKGAWSIPAWEISLSASDVPARRKLWSHLTTIDIGCQWIDLSKENTYMLVFNQNENKTNMLFKQNKFKKKKKNCHLHLTIHPPSRRSLRLLLHHRSDRCSVLSREHRTGCCCSRVTAGRGKGCSGKPVEKKMKDFWWILLGTCCCAKVVLYWFILFFCGVLVVLPRCEGSRFACLRLNVEPFWWC